MADYQKANMADVMLAAMYPEEAPSYLEKAAIHHLFSSYTVFHKEEGPAGWQQVLPSKKERLQQFIEKTYVEFEPGQVPAVRPDQKLVVKRGQLDDGANIEALNGLFQPNQPQPEMVLDFEGDDQIAGLRNENLPAQLTKLAVINSGGAVTEIKRYFLSINSNLHILMLSLPQVTDINEGFLYKNMMTTLTLSLPMLTQVKEDFLSNNPSLTNLKLSLPQLKQIGNFFLYENLSLTTLTLSLPQLTQARDFFLSKCLRLKTLILNLPQLTQVGEHFLFDCHQLKSIDVRSLLNLKEVVDIYFFISCMINLEEVLIDARQEEFFEDLLNDWPDLRPKLVIAPSA
jgi:hypothetical protein